MVCIYCGGKTEVANSRPQKRQNQVWRRRQCINCHACFTTHEAVDQTSAVMVTDNGRLSPLESPKLLISLYKSCRHRPNASRDAAALRDTCLAKIREQLTDGKISKEQVRKVAESVLDNFDRAAAVHYRAFHGES